MPQSSTMSRTLILFRGCWFSSFRKEALIACFVKFAIASSVSVVSGVYHKFSCCATSEGGKK